MQEILGVLPGCNAFSDASHKGAPQATLLQYRRQIGRPDYDRTPSLCLVPTHHRNYSASGDDAQPPKMQEPGGRPRMRRLSANPLSGVSEGAYRTLDLFARVRGRNLRADAGFAFGHDGI